MFGFCLNTRWRQNQNQKTKQNPWLKSKVLAFWFSLFFSFFFGWFLHVKVSFSSNTKIYLSFLFFHCLCCKTKKLKGLFVFSSKKHKNSRVFLIFGWNTKKTQVFFVFLRKHQLLRAKINKTTTKKLKEHQQTKTFDFSKGLCFSFLFLIHDSENNFLDPKPYVWMRYRSKKFFWKSWIWILNPGTFAQFAES